MRAEVCFTCRAHAAMSAATHRPDSMTTFFWCVESKDAEIPHPADVRLLVVDFSRGSHLNGWECIAGMVGVYEWLVAQGFTQIIKRDSDTSVEDRGAWVIPAAFLGIGVHQYGGGGGFAWNFFGCCYAISAAAVSIMRVGSDKQDIPSDDPQEDVFFSWILRGRVKINHWTAIRFTKSPTVAQVPVIAENIDNFWSPARASANPLTRGRKRYLG